MLLIIFISFIVLFFVTYRNWYVFFKKYKRRDIMPKREDINKVLVIGSGPIVIGQACEFDYSGTQACKA